MKAKTNKINLFAKVKANMNVNAKAKYVVSFCWMKKLTVRKNNLSFSYLIIISHINLLALICFQFEV